MREQLLLALLLIAAAGLRVAVARSELWLDEIWSLTFAREIVAPWQVLTGIHHDNNHPLNTLALFFAVKLAGPHGPFLVFRLLPLVTGVALVPLLFWTERQSSDEESRLRAWVAALLGAIAFLAIVYSSEARGYAPAAFFSLAAFAIVRRARLGATPVNRLPFAGCCALGLLSHLTFLLPYAGVFAWTLASSRHDKSFTRREWVRLHMLPIAFIAGYYVIDASKLVYGGGPPFDRLEVVGRTLSLAVGGPEAGLLQYATALITSSIVLWGIVDLARKKNDEAIFFAVALLLAPGGTLLLYSARFLDVRYFFVLLPFVWLLAARALGRLATGSVPGRAVAVALLGAAIVGNSVHIIPLLRDGRGHYSMAVDAMSALTAENEITVGSDNDFRNGMVLGYYAETLPPDRKLTYVQSSAWKADGPLWFLTHTFGRPRPGDVTSAHVSGPNGQRYRLVQSFPYSGISGWNWNLYRRDGAE